MDRGLGASRGTVPGSSERTVARTTPSPNCSVVALARFRPEFWGAPGDQRLFLARATKESVHELGHTYGLSHCEERACVMRFSNTLRDTDQKSDQFGPAHLQQLQEILSAYV